MEILYCMNEYAVMTYAGYRSCSDVNAQKNEMNTGVWPNAGAIDLSGLTLFSSMIVCTAR